MSPAARARAAEIAVAAAFAATAAWLFDDERSWAFFTAWLAVHVLYGIVSGSFWALVIALTCPPLLVAGFKPDGGYDTALWVQAVFVGAFYGVPLTFIGVVARRLWRLRRLAAALPDESEGETLRE
jgi:hypothetical protein